MPVTRAQKQIDFPARKSTPRAKTVKSGVTDSPQTTPSRRKRTAKNESSDVLEVLGSPPKIGRQSVRGQKENTPRRGKTDNTHGKTHVQPVRMALSPRKEPNNNIVNTNSPAKPPLMSPPPLKSPPPAFTSPLRSPQGISLASLGEVSPFVTKPANPPSANKARACLFSDNNNAEKENSPVKPLRDVLLSPKAQSMRSPVKPVSPLCKSPGLARLRMTPGKKTQSGVPGSPARALTFDSSPIKRGGQAAPPPRSPHRPRALDMQSPRKADSSQPSLMSPSPRKLLHSPLKLQPSVRMSPRKVGSPFSLARQEGLCYQRARQALHTALPDRLLCREQEHAEVTGFLSSCLDTHTPGSMYISGAPGTGKTAVLSHTLKQVESSKKAQMIYVNCMSVKNSQAIYNKVLGEITGKETSLSTKEASKQIQTKLTGKGPMICLVMDECDQLDSKNQEVLYTMFEWPHLNHSRLVLIGIANALDLTDRILPRLQAKPKCKPKIMNFAPYTKEQIVTIIKDRLSRVSVGGEQVLDPAAVVFCARKVSAVAGDMRKALDVCRRAVECVEGEVRKQQIIAVTHSPTQRPSVPKKIGVAQIMKVMNEVYGSGVSVNSQQATIPLQQKLAVCTLLLSLKGGKAKEVAMGKLHENYSRVCRQQEVPSVDQSEFMSVCTLIEARGIIGIRRTKEARTWKVSLKLDERELEQALQDKVLVSTVLRNGIPSK